MAPSDMVLQYNPYFSLKALEQNLNNWPIIHIKNQHSICLTLYRPALKT